jgi:hypothetical protein
LREIYLETIDLGTGQHDARSLAAMVYWNLFLDGIFCVAVVVGLVFCIYMPKPGVRLNSLSDDLVLSANA